MIKFIRIFIIFLSAIAILFAQGCQYLRDDGSSPTIVEAIEKQRQEGYVSTIVRELPVEDGVVVFFIRSMGGNRISLACEFVRKTRKGWKWGNGGSFGASNMRLDLTDDEARNETFTQAFIRGTKGTSFGKTPFPVLYGAIFNPDIYRMVVKDYKSGLEKQAEIVEINKHFKLYYVFLDESQGKKFDVTGYHRDGDVVKTETIDEGEQSRAGAGTTKVE